MTGRKTYLPELYATMKRAYTYATRWRDKYYADMTTEQKFALDEATDGIQSLLFLIVPPPPTPDKE